SRWWASATASQSSLAKALASAWIAACTAASPDSTKSMAGSGRCGVSCATEAMRALPGRSRSPLSGSISRISAANREDLPAPLRPITPTRQPACRARSTSDSSRRSPLRRAKLRKEIIRGIVAGPRPPPCRPSAQAAWSYPDTEVVLPPRYQYVKPAVTSHRHRRRNPPMPRLTRLALALSSSLLVATPALAQDAPADAPRDAAKTLDTLI